MRELNVSASYIDRVKSEWERFVEGKPIEGKIAPSQIYESWSRCREYGLNPYKSYRKTNAKGNTLVEAEENVKIGSYVLNQFKDFSDKYGFELQLYDQNANIITELIDYPVKRYRVSEEVAGTNAVCLALKSNQTEIVMGYEHYLKDCHGFSCSATPMKNKKGEKIGIINLIFNEPKFASTAGMISMCAARICEAVYSHFSFENAPYLEYRDIKQIMNNIPFGIACLEDDNTVKYFNERILEILRIDKNAEAEKLLTRSISVFNITGDYHNYALNVDANGVPKRVLVSTKKITDIEHSKKLIILDNMNKSENKSIFHPSPVERMTFNRIIGHNEKFVKAKELAGKAAQTELPVLICGESGTGKELFAQAIHNASSRNRGAFITINCGAIPAELVESELFGYEPGAFTGALRQGKRGQLESASGGTLFLDEIESMPMHVQIKLLRVLSTGKILKIGGIKEIPIDIRIVAATKKDLLEESDHDRFREDLCYRINAITIDLPPLRERREDIKLLAMYFINKRTEELGIYDLKTSDLFLEALPYYYWRGNVRELENVIYRSFIFLENEGARLTLDALPGNIVDSYRYNSTKECLEPVGDIPEDSTNLLRMGEEIIIEAVLKKQKYNMNQTARILGISRKTLYNKIHGNDKLCRLVERPECTKDT